jgi:hypothetical protein
LTFCPQGDKKGTCPNIVRREILIIHFLGSPNAAFHYFAMRPGMASKPYDADGKTTFGSDITKDYATKSNVK